MSFLIGVVVGLVLAALLIAAVTWGALKWLAVAEERELEESRR